MVKLQHTDKPANIRHPIDIAIFFFIVVFLCTLLTTRHEILHDYTMPSAKPDICLIYAPHRQGRASRATVFPAARPLPARKQCSEPNRLTPNSPC